MNKVWHLRKDGKEFPVELHYYTDETDYAGTAETVQWLWDKTLRPNVSTPKFLSFLHSWYKKEFNDDVDAVYHYIDEVGPDLVPTVDFLQSHEQEILAAPIGNLKSLTDYVTSVIDNEFIRVRYGGQYDDQGYKEIVFRVSSTNGFNWFDVIYMFVSNYKIKLGIKQVTIVREEHNEGFGFETKPYNYRGQTFDKMDVNEFLAIEHTPLIEKKGKR